MRKLFLINVFSVPWLMACCAVAQDQPHAALVVDATAHSPYAPAASAPGSIYIDSRPEAQPIKDEIVKKLREWGKITVVGVPEQADLVLELDQSEKLLITTGSGNRGSVVLKNRRTGEDLWGRSRGGAWSMRGWSNAWVGKRLGSDLVRWLSKNEMRIDRTESPHPH